MPLIAAVGALKRHGVPRGVAAALVRVAIVLAGALMTVVILVGITSQAPHISAQLNDAAETAARWRRDVGVDHAKAQDAQQDASEALRSIVPALLTGVAGSLKALSSLVSSSR